MFQLSNIKNKYKKNSKTDEESIFWKKIGNLIFVVVTKMITIWSKFNILTSSRLQTSLELIDSTKKDIGL